MLRVTYTRVADLKQDLDGQLAHGGLMINAAPPPGAQLHGAVALEIVLPDGTALHGEGRILHIHPGHGVAVTVPPELVTAIRERLPALSEGPRQPEQKGAAEPRRIEQMSTAEKIQLALHGSKDERAAVLRDKNRAVHPYVLKNPQITLDEVLAMAKSAMTAPDLLALIGERREWVQQPAVALALCRNPKTPQGTGVKALQYVLVPDLRQLAKGGCPPHITDAARKRVIKP